MSRAEDGDEKVEHDNRKNDQVRLVVKICRDEYWHGERGDSVVEGSICQRYRRTVVESLRAGSYENHSSTLAMAARDSTILQRSNRGSGVIAA